MRTVEHGIGWTVARSHRPRSRALNTDHSELDGIPCVYGSATHCHKRSTLGNAAHIHYSFYGPLEPFVGPAIAFITLFCDDERASQHIESMYGLVLPNIKYDTIP